MIGNKNGVIYKLWGGLVILLGHSKLQDIIGNDFGMKSQVNESFLITMMA